jgi:UDP-glucose 4-epimerase
MARNSKPRASDLLEGKKVLLTGGLGFIGSALAIRLVQLGAELTIVDAMLPGYGGNLFNVDEVRSKLRVNFSDIRDQNSLNYLIKGQDLVFHLAGQVDHILSLKDPYPDIDINIHGTAVVMEAVRRHAPQARVIYTGTRGQYGPTTKLPVSEDTEMDPRGLYELSNMTAEKIVLLYNRIHRIPAVVLRLTNVYGPRAQMLHPRYGVVNWFVRLALDDETIPIFGKGDLMRDFLYVEDCVDALILAATEDSASGKIFNVGRDTPTTFLELTKLLISLAGRGRWEFRPFSAERAAQEPGHFYSDITRIRSTLGWAPRTSLEDGLRQTIAFYRTHRAHYWTQKREE